MQNANRRLMWHGMFLFLLGLFTGFAETHFANVRMGLAAHLEGVMNGIFLLALGAAWNELRLAAAPKSTAFWLALYGCYMNWFFVVLAAVFGTGALSPITAPGLNAQPWQEKLITAGFMSVGLAIVACTLLLLWGFRSKAPTQPV
jgi:hydroxylaminobenzene mutase